MMSDADLPLPVTVAVLAGGQSRRMGRNKALLPLGGVPLIARVVAAVHGLGRETVLVTNTPAAYAELGLPLVGDVYPGCGALGGLHAAVYHSRWPHTLVVACDMPFLNRELLAWLLAQRHAGEAVVPRRADGVEPLHAVYAKSCLAALERRVQARQLKVTDFLAEVAVCYVDEGAFGRIDPAGRSFTNLNTPDDLAAADD